MIELFLYLFLQTHPCDTLATPNITIDASQATVGFCHSLLNDLGQPDGTVQFQISLDGSRIQQYQTLTPLTPANSQGSYFFQFPTKIPVTVGNHVVTVFSKNASGKEVESVGYPFVVVLPNAGPTAAYNVRAIK